VSLEINTPTEVAPENHDADMVAKFEQAQAVISSPDAPEVKPEDKPADRPEWLPEGFNSVEDFVADYNNLKSGKQEPEVKPEDLQVQGNEARFQKYFDAYAENGNLSEEDYSALAQEGLPKDVVDAYIEGLQLKATVAVNNILDSVGGKEQYTRITEWAKTNLSAEELATFNESVRVLGPNTAAAVSNLQKRYEASVGKPPKLIDGGKAGESSVYQSWAQVKADMKDTRYKSDPAFRHSVEQKLERSPGLV
jgi:hypothetical protein